jgi:protein TonB
MSLRAVTWLVSFALHGAVAGFFLITPGGAALDEGAGEDSFVVEQGIQQDYIEEIVAPPPVVQSTAPLEEVKPVEEDVQHVVGSDAGPEQEKIVREPEPEEIKEPQKEQLTAVEQLEVARDKQEATGEKKSGGDTTALSAYRGRLFSHISKKKVNPRSREVGTVVVRFTVGPQGELISREVATSSGSKLLDDAAMASIDRAAPFPAMPNEASNGPLVVSIPFKFSVR